MIVFGVILLLPGVCSGFFLVMAIYSSLSSPAGHFPSEFVLFWVLGFLVTAGGIALIVAAVRRLR